MGRKADIRRIKQLMQKAIAEPEEATRNEIAKDIAALAEKHKLGLADLGLVTRVQHGRNVSNPVRTTRTKRVRVSRPRKIRPKL